MNPGAADRRLLGAIDTGVTSRRRRRPD